MWPIRQPRHRRPCSSGARGGLPALRTVAGIAAFKARVEADESQQRPFPNFHHCPFLGMIEDESRRVGCLLHPLAHGNYGIDWRGLSYYGGMGRSCKKPGG